MLVEDICVLRVVRVVDPLVERDLDVVVLAGGDERRPHPPIPGSPAELPNPQDVGRAGADDVHDLRPVFAIFTPGVARGTDPVVAVLADDLALDRLHPASSQLKLAFHGLRLAVTIL